MAAATAFLPCDDQGGGMDLQCVDLRADLDFLCSWADARPYFLADPALASVTDRVFDLGGSGIQSNADIRDAVRRAAALLPEHEDAPTATMEDVMDGALNSRQLSRAVLGRVRATGLIHCTEVHAVRWRDFLSPSAHGYVDAAPFGGRNRLSDAALQLAMRTHLGLPDPVILEGGRPALDESGETIHNLFASPISRDVVDACGHGFFSVADTVRHDGLTEELVHILRTAGHRAIWERQHPALARPDPTGRQKIEIRCLRATPAGGDAWYDATIVSTATKAVIRDDHTHLRGSMHVLKAAEKHKVTYYTPKLASSLDTITGVAFSAFGAAGPCAHALVRACIKELPAGRILYSDSWLAASHGRRTWQSVSTAFWAANADLYYRRRNQFFGRRLSAAADAAAG